MRIMVAVVNVLPLFLPLMAFSATIHVPADQPTIQAGINAAADGDIVLLADGTFSGAGNMNLDYGGRAITVKSENGPENCIIDCRDEGRGFIFQSGEDQSSVLDGLTIWRGREIQGGAIHCDQASPTIINNIFLENYVKSFGGGVNCWHDASPRIANNRFIDNLAAYGGGGSVCARYESSPLITDNYIYNDRCYSMSIYCSGSCVSEIRNNTIVGSGIQCVRSAPLIISNIIMDSYYRSGISCTYESAPTIDDNIITGHADAGIASIRSSPEIRNNIICGNSSTHYGGGIRCIEGAPVIYDCIIEGNTALEGGGMYCDDTQVVITNCLIKNNTSSEHGAGICGRDSGLVIRNCTVVNNSTGDIGAGIYLYNAMNSTIENSIFWFNEAPHWAQIYYASGALDISFSGVQGGWAGEGNIDAEPLFVAGPLGRFYLSHADAGQPENSPCVDAGNPGSAMIEGTTRIDSVQDSGVVDMGYHAPFWVPDLRLANGTGPDDDNPAIVRIFPPDQDAVFQEEFDAYNSPHFGVNVTCGDVNGDLVDDILTGAGPGPLYGPHVRGFEVDGTPLPGLSFLAYGTNKYGVNVAAGDLDGDGREEIITGAGPGAVFGPHVRGWSYDGVSLVSAVPGVSFFAYGTPKWGANVAAGDIDGDGIDEIISGPGPGTVYGPHVRGWNVDGGAVAAIPDVSFFAYGTNQFGVKVSAGDLDGDGIDEIVTGAGPGAMFGPHVRGWNFDGDDITPLPGFSFFAWPTSPVKHGVNVFAGADLNGDGLDDLVVGRGPDPDADTVVKVFTYDGTTVSQWISLEAFPGLKRGANVAAGRF